MKKTWLQYTIGVGSVAITLLTFIGNTTRHFSTFTGWIDFTIAARITGIVAVLTGIALLLMKKRALPWRGGKGEKLRIKKLGSSIYAALGLLLAACWLTAFMNARQPEAPAAPATSSTVPPFAPAFKGARVLIIPFKTECQYGGRSQDIGYIIKQRLESLRLTDSVEIQVRYYTDSIDLRNFTDATADSLMKRFQANQILYGSYSPKECEGGASDKICFNHKTDYKQLHLDNDPSQQEYKMLNIAGLDEIRKGTGQESIDYVIYFVSGSAEYRSGKYRSAIRHFMQIKDYRHKAAVLFEIGNCHLLMKDHVTARRYFEQALAIDPGYGEALAHVANIVLDNHQPDSARYLIERAVKADPKNSCVIKSLGDFYRATNDTAKARAQYERLVQEYANSDVMLISIANTYDEMHDYNRAKTLLIQAASLHPAHPGLWNRLGLVFMKLKYDDSALLSFNNALYFKRDDALAWYCMGAIHYYNKDACNAIKFLSGATETDPQLQEAWILLSDSYRLQNDDESAIHCLEQAIAQAPTAEKVIKHAADLYIRLGRYDAAGAHYGTLARLYPDSPRYLSRLSACYAGQGQYRSALDGYRKVLQLQPGDGSIHYKIARTFSQLHQSAQALQHLRAAIALAAGLKKTAQEDDAFRWMKTNKEFVLLVR